MGNAAIPSTLTQPDEMVPLVLGVGWASTLIAVWLSKLDAFVIKSRISQIRMGIHLQFSTSPTNTSVKCKYQLQPRRCYNNFGIKNEPPFNVRSSVCTFNEYWRTSLADEVE